MGTNLGSKRRSKSGTVTTGAEKSDLSTDEVCRILETSAKSGVTSLKFGGLSVTFEKKLEPVGVPLAEPHPNSVLAPVTVLTEAQHLNQTQEVVLRDEVHLRQEQLAQAMIEDPLRWEELLRSGELTEDDVDTADIGDDE